MVEVIENQYFWVFEVILLLCFLALCNTLLKRVIVRLQKKAEGTGNLWLAHLEMAISGPFRLLLWVLLLSLSFEIADHHLDLSEYFRHAGKVRSAGVVVAIAWFLLRWETFVYEKAKERGGNFDLTSLAVGDRIFTIVVFFVAGLSLLSVFHVDVMPLLTIGGIGAAAIGLASKDALANCFGGLTLYATRPFHVNDLIELPAKDLTGYVENIGWYFTAIRKPDKSLVYVPNSAFPTESIINLSRMTHRYLSEIITVSSNDRVKIPELIKKLTALLKKSYDIEQTLPIYIYVAKIHGHGIDIEVKAYVIPTVYSEFMQAKERLLLSIQDVLKEMDIVQPTSLDILRKMLGELR